jgi:hypothetical protein
VDACQALQILRPAAHACLCRRPSSMGTLSYPCGPRRSGLQHLCLSRTQGESPLETRRR